MNTLFTVLSATLVNTVIGAAVCSTLDTEDEVFYNWYKRDPTGGLFSFVVLTLWPVMAFFMIKYRIERHSLYKATQTKGNQK